MTRLLFVVVPFLVSSLNTIDCCGSFFLTGAQVYAADSNGQIVSLTSNYRYSTNDLDTSASRVSLTTVKTDMSSTTMDRKISFELLVGQSVDFTFAVTTNDALPTVPNEKSYVGMNLFFGDPPPSAPTVSDNTVDNSYNPGRSLSRPGNLTIFAELNGSSFNFVSSVYRVQNYDFADSNIKPFANGLSRFEYEGYFVTVTSFLASSNAPHKPMNGAYGGSFTLSVTATPEPSTIGVGALALLGVVHWVKKRRKGKMIGKTTAT